MLGYVAHHGTVTAHDAIVAQPLRIGATVAYRPPPPHHLLSNPPIRQQATWGQVSDRTAAWATKGVARLFQHFDRNSDGILQLREINHMQVAVKAVGFQVACPITGHRPHSCVVV